MACTYYSLLTVDMSSHGNRHQKKVEQRNGDCWFNADVTAADNTTEETQNDDENNDLMISLRLLRHDVIVDIMMIMIEEKTQEKIKHFKVANSG